MSSELTFKDILREAAAGGYGVGSFSPRYTKMILPVIEAAVELISPVIVQISEKELNRHQVELAIFSAEFYRVVSRLGARPPILLHLDHTKTMAVIKEAIDRRFMSVMIDASDREFDENVRISKETVDYAHSRGVYVEAELGRISSADLAETDTNEEYFTDPAEAERFVLQTGVDALAVSVGTAHGFYHGREPNIRYGLLQAINRRVSVPLVLHGGSDVPAEKIALAVGLPTGGAAKVNIATDLERAMLRALGREGHMTDAELNTLSAAELEKARLAVKETVKDKMRSFLFSAGKATAKQVNTTA
ncbi:MAG: class II fructose-bisphosphate aldolase [Clostridiales bacterium]|nr:class II fructose-bisphosphate aldolase [Clostridiales bacterium]